MFGGQQHPHMEVYNELEADECGSNNDVLEVGDGPIVESRYWCDQSLVPFPPANPGLPTLPFVFRGNQSITNTVQHSDVSIFKQRSQHLKFQRPRAFNTSGLKAPKFASATRSQSLYRSPVLGGDVPSASPIQPLDRAGMNPDEPCIVYLVVHGPPASLWLPPTRRSRFIHEGGAGIVGIWWRMDPIVPHFSLSALRGSQ